MKYRLKKDLPFAKAGAKVEVDNGIWAFMEELQLFHWISCTSELTRLIEEGWIEEIKPREIWINEYDDGLANNPYNTLEDANNGAIPNRIRCVKFIEAL